MDYSQYHTSGQMMPHSTLTESQVSLHQSHGQAQQVSYSGPQSNSNSSQDSTTMASSDRPHPPSNQPQLPSSHQSRDQTLYPLQRPSAPAYTKLRHHDDARSSRLSSVPRPLYLSAPMDHPHSGLPMLMMPMSSLDPHMTSHSHSEPHSRPSHPPTPHELSMQQQHEMAQTHTQTQGHYPVHQSHLPQQEQYPQPNSNFASLEAAIQSLPGSNPLLPPSPMPARVLPAITDASKASATTTSKRPSSPTSADSEPVRKRYKAIRTGDTVPDPFLCYLCYRRLVSKSSVQRHLRDVHGFANDEIDLQRIKMISELQDQPQQALAGGPVSRSKFDEIPWGCLDPAAQGYWEVRDVGTGELVKGKGRPGGAVINAGLALEDWREGLVVGHGVGQRAGTGNALSGVLESLHPAHSFSMPVPIGHPALMVTESSAQGMVGRAVALRGGGGTERMDMVGMENRSPRASELSEKGHASIESSQTSFGVSTTQSQLAARASVAPQAPQPHIPEAPQARPQIPTGALAVIAQAALEGCERIQTRRRKEAEGIAVRTKWARVSTA